MVALCLEWAQYCKLLVLNRSQRNDWYSGNILFVITALYILQTSKDKLARFDHCSLSIFICSLHQQIVARCRWRSLILFVTYADFWRRMWWRRAWLEEMFLKRTKAIIWCSDLKLCLRCSAMAICKSAVELCLCRDKPAHWNLRYVILQFRRRRAIIQATDCTWPSSKFGCRKQVSSCISKMLFIFWISLRTLCSSYF